MSRFLIIFIALAGFCVAEDNSTSTNEYCVEYADCMAKAQVKSAECAAASNESSAETNSTSSACSSIKGFQAELEKLYAERSEKVISCIRDKASEAEVLTGKKASKCASALKKVKKSGSETSLKREKRKDKRDRKHGRNSVCVKEAKRIRSSCSKISRCCSVTKECATSVPKDSIVEKKQEVKTALKECRKEKIDKKRKNKHAKKGKKADASEVIEEEEKEKKSQEVKSQETSEASEEKKEPKKSKNSKRAIKKEQEMLVVDSAVQH